MTYSIARQRRAAVNLEYILLIICSAILLMLGLHVLANDVNLKHVEVAEALSTQGATTVEQPAAEMTVGTPEQNPDGTYSIGWSGGVPPYTVYREGVVTTSTSDASVSIAPYGVPTNYAIHDAAGSIHEFTITTALACVDCHTMTDLPHIQHASLSCTSDCHTACRDMTTAMQGDPLCETCHAPALP